MIGDYSLYFHVPFCNRKCDYCNFFVIPNKDNFKKMYMQGLEEEWKLQTFRFNSAHNLVSIYFGGGTPALIGPENLAKIIDWIKPAQDVEITLEANPENVDFDLMKSYADCGVNRVSIGVQTLDDSLLKNIGRTHDAKKAIEAVCVTKEAGISNISIDLMYDLPDQTLYSWRQTLQKALKLPITHLSLYNLTIEPHTVFFKKKEMLMKKLPLEALSLQFLDEALKELSAHGFTRYEISAFCRDNKISKHNIGYWQGRPFLGFGPSAFSYWDGKRFKNVANLSQYCKRVSQNHSAVDFEEELSSANKLKEQLVIGLRVIEGINIIELQESQFFDKETTQTVENLISTGYLSKHDNILKMTKKGLLFYDTIAERLI